MRIAKILAGLPILHSGLDLAREVRSLAYDSRRVRPGDLFFAIQGELADGYDFVSDAMRRGAVGVVSERGTQKGLEGAWVRVENARRCLALAARNFYGRADRGLQLVGVTGTNGKTTVCYLLEAILRAAGRPPGLLGTIEYHLGRRHLESTHTTPESLELHEFFSELVAAGKDAVVMEVSSHALSQQRVFGCHFKAAVFTNLGQDHLDYHATLENYWAAKKSLFIDTGAGPPDMAVVNRDDPWGGRLRREIQGKKMTYGFNKLADVYPLQWQAGFSGLKASLATPEGKMKIASPLAGEHNLSNLMAAAATGLGLGIPKEVVVDGISRVAVVPGRFERIEAGQPFGVVVDYAHTVEALRKVLESARRLKRGKLITVFGCGGSRDREKRPRMGETVGSLSDLAILTLDNPRAENPLRILNDVQVGLQKASGKYLVEPERAQAIRMALEAAHEGDLVLVAGKGHETRQIFADEQVPFDDRDVCRQFLATLGYHEPPPPRARGGGPRRSLSRGAPARRKG